jgi:HSP20 family protein
MTLERIDPKTHLTTLREAIDRLFEEPWTFHGMFFHDDTAMAPVNVSEDDKTITVKAALPGVERDDIDVNVTGRVVRIRGEHKAEEEKKEENYHRREIQYGRVERVIDLPAAVDEEGAEGTFKDGMLTLTFRKKEEEKSKSIPIKD